MAVHAGFAAALTIRERLIEDAILAAWASESSPPSFSADLPGGPPDVRIEAFLAPARIRCNANDSLSIAVRLWGSLSVRMHGVESTGDIDAWTSIRMWPSFRVSGTKLRLSPTAGDVTVSSWHFTVTSGGPFPADADAYLRSSAFRERLQTAVRDALQAGALRLPEIDIGFLGHLPAGVSLSADSRVREGAVLIGLNLVSDSWSLVGDARQLGDFARSNDFAAVTNAAAVPVFLRSGESQVRDLVAEHGATLEELAIRPEAGRLQIAGRMSRSGESTAFSFALVPAMTHTRAGAYFPEPKRPVYVKPRTWPAIDFSVADIHVDVIRSVWVVVVEEIGALLAGKVLPPSFEDTAREVAVQLRSAVGPARTRTPVPRVRRLKSIRRGGPGARIEIASYRIGVEGTYIGVDVQMEAAPGAVIGLTSIPANYHSETLVYAVRLPVDARFDDPALRIRWTVAEPASGQVLASDEGPAAGRETFSFTPADFDPNLSRLQIGCRVYRAIGLEIGEVFSDEVTLEIRGPLPPGAYVRWRYDVKNPQVALDPESETWSYEGEARRSRWSNIHRTDRPCAMMAKRSRYTYSTEIHDVLPFRLEQLAAYRSQLCDYCFFGGPGRLRPSL